MDLYDVKARGLHSPLNAREISQLFRAGHFGSQQPCKPVGEARWCTVDELFPLLKIEAAAGPLRMEEPKAGLDRIPRTVKVLLALLLGAGAFLFWPRTSAKEIPATVASVPTPTILPQKRALEELALDEPTLAAQTRR
ncbi:MAG: hypothetical protein ABIR38_00510 [Chthoniobacterales bacterium]